MATICPSESEIIAAALLPNVTDVALLNPPVIVNRRRPWPFPAGG